MSRWIRWTLIASTVLAATLASVIGWHSTRWVGSTFPGFFVMVNRVVPSIGRADWGPAVPSLFQHQVMAVDGVPVGTPEALYALVAQHPAGTPITYSLRAADGTLTTETVRSRRFTWSDYLAIFGAFVLTGASFLGAALLVAWLRPMGTASVGMVSACVGLGVFALTAADLYGPYWFVRLHILAEALFPAGFIHLALVFPRPRLARLRRSILLSVYETLLLLGLFYEVVLYWPSAYTMVHLVASAAHGLCGVAIVAAVVYDRCTTTSALIRWRIGIVGAGTVTAFVGPTLLMGSSGLLGGGVPVNGAALTAFLFPISMAYAMLRRDLLDTDIFGQLGSGGSDGGAASQWAAQLMRRASAVLKRLDRLAGGHLLRGALSLGGLLAAALIGTTAYHSTAWLGASFPGFFVMHNRVVPSVALAEWAGANEIFQHEIVAVDQRPVADAAAIYAHVRRQPVGTTVRYLLRGPDGTLREATLPSRRFSEADYANLFAAFLLTGSAFLIAGLTVFGLRPRSAAACGMLSAGVCGGVFVLTAVDLYSPFWFFRLHVAAEALVPASLIHLALVFPRNRLRRGLPLLLASYLGCLVLAVLYELALYRPVAYSAVHLAASTAQAVGGLTLIWTITYDLLTTQAKLVRRRVMVAAFGTLAAFLLPTALMALSGLNNGHVPVNAAALTGFLFPLSFAYAIARRDLLKVDLFVATAAGLLLSLGVTTFAATAHRLSDLAARWQ